MERWYWVNFQCRGVLLIWIIVGQRAYFACRRCGWGLFGHFSLIYHFSFLSPFLWETARYRLKYCLKGPLSPKQPTNQPAHRRHMSEQFFRSNIPGYPHPLCSELENSGIRVAVCDSSVIERRRWRPPSNRQNCTCARKHTTNTTRTDARPRVCVAMVPYR